MLYVLSQGHAEYQGGQEPVVHLVSSVSEVMATGRPWFFTDRHADLAYARQFDSTMQLDQVDWPVMLLKYWSDSETKEKRQAEFLVYDWCPWKAIQTVGVMNVDIAAEVTEALTASDHRPEVTVRASWYY